MKTWLLFATVALLTVGGCSYGSSAPPEAGPHEWRLPGPKYESKVFGPLPYEEVKTFVQQKESEGWRVAGFEPAGPELEGRYLIVMNHWTQ